MNHRMKIAVAADHAGFPLKARILEEVRKLGHHVLDLGTHSTDAVDYPDYARAGPLPSATEQLTALFSSAVPVQAPASRPTNFAGFALPPVTTRFPHTRALRTTV